MTVHFERIGCDSALRTGRTLPTPATRNREPHGIISLEPRFKPCRQNSILSLLLHAHQPVGNFEEVFERCYQRAYLPFVQRIEKHPRVRLALHYSGPLLVWIRKRIILNISKPAPFAVKRRQVEIVGGGFYEPILAVIPPEDQREQIERLTAYLEQHFGERPTGAWLAERVWEPQLPSVLAASPSRHTRWSTIFIFFRLASNHRSFSAYISRRPRRKECVCLPDRKRLRYLIPFGKVEDVIQVFARMRRAMHPDGVAAFGDDMEKFGVWPGTFKHCYDEHWLENFLSALDANSDWLSLLHRESTQKRKARWGARTCPQRPIRKWASGLCQRPCGSDFTRCNRNCRGGRKLSTFCRAARGVDFSENIQNQICCTRKCCEPAPVWQQFLAVRN